MARKTNLNSEVTKLLDDLKHPLRKEIELIRLIILNADSELSENIKWNGPNYHIGEDDRITMRVQPPKQIQLIFHRGAKKQAQPKNKLVTDTAGILAWKENDRAVATFKNMAEIESNKAALAKIVKDWISAAS